ncbi:hypothetical protein AVEN_152136-1, partial [Araneus ventricosus]
LIGEYSVFEEGDQENIQDWLECDADNPGYLVMSEGESIANVINDEEEPSDNDFLN